MGKGKRAVVPACIGRNTFWSNSIEMPFLPFSHFTPALLVAKIREMYPEADGNYMGFKRKGAEEKMSWKSSYTWNSAICMKYILVWIPSEGRMTELMDSLSSSDDRIGGFPQQVGCWNCQQEDSLSRSEDRIDGFPQQLWGQNRWIPSAGRMPLGSYLVNFWPFDLIFDPLWGFSVKIAFWNFS